MIDFGKNDKWGLMNAKGEIIIPCQYDMLIGSFNEWGLAEVRRDNLYGFVNQSGKEVISCKYQSVGQFSEGLLDVRLNEKWGYVDTTGNTVIPHKV